jgi:hypothetical protein
MRLLALAIGSWARIVGANRFEQGIDLSILTVPSRHADV